MDGTEELRRREFLQRTAMAAGVAAGMAAVVSPDVLVAEAGAAQRRTPLPSPRNLPVDTFVVLMMENRSFDHYLGWLPNADGHQAGLSYATRDGQAVATHRLAPDFQGCAFNDPDHSWDGGREQVNGGAMDGFLRSGDNDEFAVGYYAEEDLPFLPAAAHAFTTYDRFFCSLLASTFPNREYMLDGGPGDDRLTAGPDADDLVAGDGNDLIDARNGVEDSIDCGPGDDTAIVDAREDGVLDCENVQSP